MPGKGRFKIRSPIGIAVAVAAVSAAACGTERAAAPAPVATSESEAATPRATPTPVCPASGVLITPGQVEAAMGLRVLHLEMVNCGTRSFTVEGYPELRVLDAGHRVLDVHIGRGSSGISRIEQFDRPPRRVRLTPGDRARAFLTWRNTVTLSTEPAVHGAHLRIAPAAGAPAQTVTPDGGVDLGTTGRLGMSPWIRD